tara:strand:- start:103 stop:726 length:624 start_codon:yes stop_codon:yes gene_type:complete
MPLWGTTATAATNKPKFLTDDTNSDYDITRVFATNSGWAQRAGSAATGNDNTSADDEVLVAIGGLAGLTTSTGLAHPTISRVRWGESAYTGAVAVTILVTWDEQVKYVAGSAATLAVNSTGTNRTLTATHIDGVAIADGLIGNTITFTGTTVDQNATLNLADDVAIGDPDLVDALGANDALSGADATTITAAVKTASGFGTRAVTAS